MSIDMYRWGKSFYASHNGKWYRNAVTFNGWVESKEPSMNNLSPVSKADPEYLIHSQLFEAMIINGVNFRVEDPLEEAIGKKYNFKVRRQLPQDWLNNLQAKERQLFNGFYEKYRSTFDEMIFSGDSPEDLFNEFIRFMETTHKAMAEKGDNPLAETVIMRSLHKAYIDAQAANYDKV